jgi:hypothetical protein
MSSDKCEEEGSEVETETDRSRDLTGAVTERKADQLLCYL